MVTTVETPQIIEVVTVPLFSCIGDSGLHAGIVRRAGSMLPEFPAPTRSAHSGLHAGIVRRAGSMLPEFPASPREGEGRAVSHLRDSRVNR